LFKNNEQKKYAAGGTGRFLFNYTISLMLDESRTVPAGLSRAKAAFRNGRRRYAKG
jgi:hypothetical protein